MRDKVESAADSLGWITAELKFTCCGHEGVHVFHGSCEELQCPECMRMIPVVELEELLEEVTR